MIASFFPDSKRPPCWAFRLSCFSKVLSLLICSNLSIFIEPFNVLLRASVAFYRSGATIARRRPNKPKGGVFGTLS